MEKIAKFSRASLHIINRRRCCCGESWHVESHNDKVKGEVRGGIPATSLYLTIIGIYVFMDKEKVKSVINAEVPM